eukprot:tig00020952_g16472.t1
MASLGRLSADLTDLLQPAPAVSRAGYVAIGGAGLKTREERERSAGVRSSYAQGDGPKILEDYGTGDAAQDAEELFDYNVDRGRDKPISSSPRLSAMQGPDGLDAMDGPQAGVRRPRPTSAASSSAAERRPASAGPFRPLQTVNAASLNMSLLELAHSRPKYRAIEYHGVAPAAPPARSDEAPGHGHGGDGDSPGVDAAEEAARRGRWAPGKSTASRLAARSAKWYRPRSAPAGVRSSHYFRTTYRSGRGFRETPDGTPAIPPDPRPPPEDAPPIGHYRPRFGVIDKAQHVPTFAPRASTPPRDRPPSPPPSDRLFEAPPEKPLRPSSAFRSPSRERPPSGRLFPPKAGEAPDVAYEPKEEVVARRTPVYDFSKTGDRSAPIPRHTPLQMSDGVYQPPDPALALRSGSGRASSRPGSASGGVPFKLQVPREQRVSRAAQEQEHAFAHAHNLVYRSGPARLKETAADPLGVDAVSGRNILVPDFSRQGGPASRPASAAASASASASGEAHPAARLDCSESLVTRRPYDVLFKNNLTRAEENRSNASRDFTQNTFPSHGRVMRPQSTGPYAHNLMYDGALEYGKKRARNTGEFHAMLGRPGSANMLSSPSGSASAAGSRPRTAGSTRPSSAAGFGLASGRLSRGAAASRPASAGAAFRQPPAAAPSVAGSASASHAAAAALLPEAHEAATALKRQEGSFEYAHSLVYDAPGSADRLAGRTPGFRIERQLSREARARMLTPKPAGTGELPTGEAAPGAKDALIGAQRHHSPDFSKMAARRALVSGGLRAPATVSFTAPTTAPRATSERDALMSIARQRLAAAAAATAERQRLIAHLHTKYGQTVVVAKRR